MITFKTAINSIAACAVITDLVVPFGLNLDAGIQRQQRCAVGVLNRLLAAGATLANGGGCTMLDRKQIPNGKAPGAGHTKGLPKDAKQATDTAYLTLPLSTDWLVVNSLCWQPGLQPWDTPFTKRTTTGQKWFAAAGDLADTWQRPMKPKPFWCGFRAAHDV